MRGILWAITALLLAALGAFVFWACLVVPPQAAAQVVEQPIPRPPAANEAFRLEVLAGLKKAVEFYRTKVARHGGYVYYVSEDLSQRWGEGKADADTIFVQPPGTPTVGMAYLNAYLATDDKFFLDAATETALALVNGQLKSGGWSQTIHFRPAERLGDYRTRKGGKWNQSSLDDDQTQSALRFLLEMDYELSFKHAQIHDAARYGLDSLIAARFANGAFPQVFAGPATPQPIVKAKYPDYDWKTEGRLKNYWDYYTLNDGLAGTVSDLLIDASKLAENQAQADKAEAALRKLGDSLLLAQMPDPQPAWCQQYNYAMEPIWARKFEPPAITGSESQDVMRTLIKIAKFTGDAKYLEPIPRAVAFFNQHLLPDGRVPRYYELKTSKPLYMNAEYQLTYDDSNAPSHYGWKVNAKFDEIAKERNIVATALESTNSRYTPDWSEHFRPARRRHRPDFDVPIQTLPGSVEALRRRIQKSADLAKQVLGELDAQGRWVSTYDGESLTGQPKFAKGFKYISSAVFAKNIDTLSEYLWTLEE